ncbi:MAG: hypothetical protein ABIG03_05525 [Candidatus Eisenbacteria bacterium]
MTPLVLLALLSSVVLMGGCAKDLVEADQTPPTGSRITNPADGSALNNQVINVRGRAEVGATVEILVDGVSKGTDTASPPAPSEGGLGRFTVESVQLGIEGPKELRGVVTDLYGNRADNDLIVNIILDMQAPPVAFENLVDAQWDTVEGVPMWQTGVPAVTLIGRTDTTATYARVRYGINEFTPDSTYTFPAGPGEPDSVRFWIPMNAPLLTPANPDSLVTYFVEAVDEAGNTSSEAFQLNWAAAGKETILAWDDSEYGYVGNRVTGQAGMSIAVLFQAPPWANFVTGMELYLMTDGVVNPIDPQAPTTAPFLAYIWEPSGDLRPAAHANDGYTPFDWYAAPEDAMVDFYFPNAINITNNNDFPDKQFFAGIEFQFRNNPIIGIDTDEPIDSRSFRWNWTEWEMSTTADYIIHAIVSDLQHSAGGRTAVLQPTSVTVVPMGR